VTVNAALDLANPNCFSVNYTGDPLTLRVSGQPDGSYRKSESGAGTEQFFGATFKVNFQSDTFGETNRDDRSLYRCLFRYCGEFPQHQSDANEVTGAGPALAAQETRFGGFLFVRPAWARSWRWRSSREPTTASEVKRNCVRGTERWEEARSETASRGTRAASEAAPGRASRQVTATLLWSRPRRRKCGDCGVKDCVLTWGDLPHCRDRDSMIWLLLRPVASIGAARA